MSVGHADLGHVGPADVVPLWSVFQIVHPNKVLLILETNDKHKFKKKKSVMSECHGW